MGISENFFAFSLAQAVNFSPKTAAHSIIMFTSYSALCASVGSLVVNRLYTSISLKPFGLAGNLESMHQLDMFTM